MKKFFYDLWYYTIIAGIMIGFVLFVIGMLIFETLWTLSERVIGLFKKTSDMTDRNGHTHIGPRSGPQRGSPLGVNNRTL